MPKPRWQPTEELRPLVRLLGSDPKALANLRAELERTAKEENLPAEHVAAAKAALNDWVIGSLRKAERAGVTDWGSAAAERAFGFETFESEDEE